MVIGILNVVAHAMQALLLVLAGSVAERALRHAHPVARLTLWRLILALVVLLPLIQPWQQGAAGYLRIESSADAAVKAVGAGVTVWQLPVPWATVVAALLVSGAAARLMWIGLGLIRLQRLRRDAEPIVLPDAFLRAMAALDVHADVRVSDAAGPVSFGVRSPVIVLPRRFFDQHDAAQYLVAYHELLHVRRRDALQTLVEEIVISLLWYQPWLWWLRSRVRLAREQLVDRAVTRDRGSRDPYIRTLLVMTGHRVPGLADAAAPRGRELRVRIEALYREVSMSRTRLVLTTIAIAIFTAALATTATAAFPLVATPFGIAAGGQQQEDDVVKVGGEIPPPKKTKHVNPVYPPEAKEAGIEGVVILGAVIGPDGLVKRTEVEKSIPELDPAAIEAVMQWEFEPTYVKGKAVSVKMTITINFTLK